MSTSRHLSRIIALQSLFAYEFDKVTADDAFNYICGEFKDKISDFSFAKMLFYGVIENKKEIHQKIEQYAPQWPIEKIARIDRVILEIAIFEMTFDGDVPGIVALDEAIELGKTFGNKNSPKFINGVLNALFNDTGTARKLTKA